MFLKFGQKLKKVKGLVHVLEFRQKNLIIKEVNSYFWNLGKFWKSRGINSCLHKFGKDFQKSKGDSPCLWNSGKKVRKSKGINSCFRNLGKILKR